MLELHLTLVSLSSHGVLAVFLILSPSFDHTFINTKLFSIKCSITKKKKSLGSATPNLINLLRIDKIRSISNSEEFFF